MSTDSPWRELEALDIRTDVLDAFGVGVSNEARADDYFGVCPVCLRPGVCYNIGREHWFVCEEHRVRWYVGSALFGTWRDESEEQWARNWEKMKDYDDVKAIGKDGA
jgi:hypothetical protein